MMAMFSVDHVLMRLDEDSDDDFDGYLDDSESGVERGWEESCKAKNKYATFFLGTLYWQISHDNILGVFPFHFAETGKAWEQRYFLLLSQGKMTHLMQQKVIPMVLS